MRLLILIGDVVFYFIILIIGIITFYNINYYSIMLIIGMLLITLVSIFKSIIVYKKSILEGYKIYYESFNKKVNIYIVVKKAIGNHNVATVGSTIFIEEKVKNVLNEKELYSILQHEYGHIKNYHGYKVFLLRIISFGLAFNGWHMAIYKNIQYSLPALILGVVSVLLSYFYIRRTEYVADEYAIRNGIEKDELFQALTKINNLNYNKANKMVIKDESHPTLDKRISHIENLKL